MASSNWRIPLTFVLGDCVCGDQFRGPIGVGMNKVERLVGSFRWLLWLSLAVLILLALALGLSVLNNNVAFSRLSRISFVNSLDQSVAASTGWTLRQFSFGASGELITTDLGAEFASNPALVHMLVDTAGISGDARLQQLSSTIVAIYDQGHVGLMGKLVDPAMAGPPLNTAELEEYQRWFLHALSPAAFLFVRRRTGGHVLSRQVQDVRRHPSIVCAYFLPNIQRGHARVARPDGSVGEAHRGRGRARFPGERLCISNGSPSCWPPAGPIS